jgi:hypothetical protein
LTEDDGNDISAKEQYILSCLSQSKQKTKPKPDRLLLKTTHHKGLAEDRLGYQQKALEKLNNVINSQYLDCQDNKTASKTQTEVDIIITYLDFKEFGHCHDRMVVRFTTTYSISAYHH